jgi:hypothetical protein
MVPFMVLFFEIFFLFLRKQFYGVFWLLMYRETAKNAKKSKSKGKTTGEKVLFLSFFGREPLVLLYNISLTWTPPFPKGVFGGVFLTPCVEKHTNTQKQKTSQTKEEEKKKVLWHLTQWLYLCVS